MILSIAFLASACSTINRTVTVEDLMRDTYRRACILNRIKYIEKPHQHDAQVLGIRQMCFDDATQFDLNVIDGYDPEYNLHIMTEPHAGRRYL